MISLPEGFDLGALLSNFFTLAAGPVGIAFLIALGSVVKNMLKNASK
ncbi:MAG: hypothetical protein PHI97_21940 [Desulfobulbus sp.]|nr:hypothetical protein [Desulfobulbus sp.]